MRNLVHAAVMLNNGLTKVATFDGGFDRVKGIERLPLSRGSADPSGPGRR